MTLLVERVLDVHSGSNNLTKSGIISIRFFFLVVLWAFLSLAYLLGFASVLHSLLLFVLSPLAAWNI